MPPPYKIRRRRSIRLPGYDYTRPCAYFVTLVTWKRERLFGDVVDGNMSLNKFGMLVENEWRRLEKRFGYVAIGDFVIMPNHMHGIAWIIEPDSAADPSPTGTGQQIYGPPPVGAGQKYDRPSGESSLAPPLRTIPPSQLSPPQQTAPLGTIIGTFKSTTARLINGLWRTAGSPVWQRNYYEHIIRDQNELARIYAYIASNPASWQTDEENR